MQSAENFLPIQSLDIEAETSITFNLYVNLPLNKKYILYRRPGGQVEFSKMEKMTEGNLSTFFIEKKDYNEFIKYVAHRLCGLLQQGDSFQKQRSMASAAKTILSSTMDQRDPSIAAAMMANLNDIAGLVIENSLENTDTTSKKLFHRLVQLAEKGTDFQRHPVNVASLAILITFGIGYSRSQMLSDVAMAALLHDLGLSKLPPRVGSHAHEILKLKINDRSLIYQHPQLSVAIIEEKKIPISALAKTIILQHHEEFNGSGYPCGLRGFQINELAQIVRIADEIDQLFQLMYEKPAYLRARVMELLQRFSDEKSVEPMLLARVRRVLL